jgi:nucleoside-diphosphate-sugar epimerase
MSDGGEVLITGGSGFLGVALAELLLASSPPPQIVLTDIAEHRRLDHMRGRLRFLRADLSDPRACRALVTPTTATVYHFASLVSGGAEKDFEAGLRANVYATVNLLEACRLSNARPRVIFTSSIATFGGSRLPREVDDWTHQHPQNSYGVAKVLGEQLLNDYSRKGFLDGRGLRLPAIVVRDEPNTAASGYASAIIREPLAGRAYVCPVSEETRIPVLSVRRGVSLLAALAALPPDALGDYRTINGPSLSPSAGEMAEAVRACSLGGPARGRISFAPDPAIQRMVASWPRVLRADRARALGLNGDADIAQIVRDYARALTEGNPAP